MPPAVFISTLSFHMRDSFGRESRDKDSGGQGRCDPTKQKSETRTPNNQDKSTTVPTLWQLSRLILVVGGGLWVVGCGLLGVAVIAVTVTVVVIVVVVVVVIGGGGGGGAAAAAAAG